jgi:hypothetical protein
VRDGRNQKAAEKEEERLWSMQQEANRQLMLQNEVTLNENKAQMVKDLKDQHKRDQVAKKNRWDNPYGDKDPLPALNE